MLRLLSRLRARLRRGAATPQPPAGAAIAANERGSAAREAGDLDTAAAAYRQAARLAPRWEAPWFNLGIVTKLTGRWSECAQACRRVLELDPRSEGAAWNLGVAATALGDWAAARDAWTRFGLSVPEGEGPVQMELGDVPIRVNPAGDAEVVWCNRIDPARAVIRSIPFPESGRRHGDLLLHDGAPSGWRKVDGREVPVFDELALLAPSALSTFVVETEQPAPEDSLELAEAFTARGLTAEDWTIQTRMLCRTCSEGHPPAEGEEHDHDHDAEWQPHHRVGVAASDASEVRTVLAAWAAGRDGRRYGEIELGIEGAAERR